MSAEALNAAHLELIHFAVLMVGAAGFEPATSTV
jgi:hypothetical protein